MSCSSFCLSVQPTAGPMWHLVNLWKEDRKEGGGISSMVSCKESENEEFQKPPNLGTDLQILYIAPPKHRLSRLFLNIFLSRLLLE